MREEIQHSDGDSDGNAAGTTGSSSEADRARSAVDRLRTYINGLVEVITAHPDPSFERDEAEWRLEELAAELATPDPSAPRVKSRWIRLAPVLLEVRPDVPVPALNDLIDAAFPPARQSS